ncbi:ABC transporter ATP-binding protein [Nocardioides dubius]|uniref:ABC transporter domain-containing protein n=1 Tax=Nocardioides dubius TaxID=317019 RepID=A0ABN1TYB7_9ACTN
MGAQEVFRTESLSVRYGGLVALDAVSITVRPGELAGLIGPNGAGKTTFIDAVTGFTPTTGRVLLGERELQRLPAHKRVSSGISRTFQSLELFEDLSIRENVLVSTEESSWLAPLREFVVPRRGDKVRKVREVLELVGLDGVEDAYPPDLSLAERKLVCVARALATDPSLLLLDEPAAGLDSDASLELGAQLRKVADSGVSILLVDHDMDLVLEFCESLSVLNFGKLIATGPTAEVRNDEAVLTAYLGADDADDDLIALEVGL